MEPVPAPQPCLQGGHVRHGDKCTASGLEEAVYLLQHGCGLVNVLEHMPEHDCIEVSWRKGTIRVAADVNAQVQHVAGVPRRALTQFGARRLPSPAAQGVQEQALAASDVESGSGLASVGGLQKLRPRPLAAVEQSLDRTQEAPALPVIRGRIVSLQ